MAPRDGREGTQSIHRAIDVLRAVADGGSPGLLLTEVAELVDLAVPTTHRILSALVRRGLLDRDPGTRRFVVGLEVLALGTAVEHRLNLNERFGPVLQSLARATDDTALLTIRSGSDAICIGRVDGGFPVRPMSLAVGSRRPLGIGGGSLAILAFLPKAEANTVIDEERDALGAFGQTADDVRQMVLRSRHLGYALNDGYILPGMRAVGVPIATQDGRIVAAISVAAVDTRLPPDRRARIVEIMRREIGRRQGLAALS